jgi:hypothetical protein
VNWLPRIGLWLLGMSLIWLSGAGQTLALGNYIAVMVGSALTALAFTVSP